MTVAHILASKPNEIIGLSPSSTLLEVSKLLAERRIGAILLLNDDESIAGIISERDIVRALAKHGAEAISETAASFMTRELITCKPEDTTDRVMSIMTDGRVRHLPVMSGTCFTSDATRLAGSYRRCGSFRRRTRHRLRRALSLANRH